MTRETRPHDGIALPNCRQAASGFGHDRTGWGPPWAPTGGAR